MYKLIFFVPASHLDVVKDAVFAAGAGRQGDYEHCAWQTLGTGQFKPMDGAQPFLGAVGQLEQVEEWRVETLVAAEYLPAAILALKRAHPYEEPAYEVVALVST